MITETNCLTAWVITKEDEHLVTFLSKSTFQVTVCIPLVAFQLLAFISISSHWLWWLPLSPFWLSSSLPSVSSVLTTAWLMSWPTGRKGTGFGGTWSKTRESRWIWWPTFSEDSFSWTRSRGEWTLWRCTSRCPKKWMRHGRVWWGRVYQSEGPTLVLRHFLKLKTDVFWENGANQYPVFPAV